jgi:hypothetical protein
MWRSLTYVWRWKLYIGAGSDYEMCTYILMGFTGVGTAFRSDDGVYWRSGSYKFTLQQ